MPDWVHQLLNDWIVAAGIQTGKPSEGEHAGNHGRRTDRKAGLASGRGSELEQIQFLLGMSRSKRRSATLAVRSELLPP